MFVVIDGKTRLLLVEKSPAGGGVCLRCSKWKSSICYTHANELARPGVTQDDFCRSRSSNQGPGLSIVSHLRRNSDV